MFVKGLHSPLKFDIIIKISKVVMLMDTAQRSDRARRRQLRQRIEWGRMGILVVVAISLINQILLWCRVQYHLLFSAAMPYYLNWLAGQLGTTGFKVMATLLTILLYLAYAVCWLMAGHRRDWLLASIGLYGFDTLLLIVFALTLLKNPISCLLEVLTHGIVLAVLVIAYMAAADLSKMPRLRRTPPAPVPEAEE